jgi:cytochrome c oxidase assembly factor CtaG
LPTRLRLAALGGALAVLVLSFVPPIWTSAHRYEFVESVQFAVFAFAVPALLVVGRPWGRIGGTGRGRIWGHLEVLQARRARHPDFWRAAVFALPDVALVVLWRTPAWMDALARHRWLVGLEAVSLVVAGVGLWLELIACAPLAPRLPRPWRAVLAAGCMWITWIMAYIVGFSHVSWYRGFAHAGSLLGASMDQEFATAVVWFAAACAFVPLIFADVFGWLKSEEDPDAELRRLVRAVRRSGRA